METQNKVFINRKFNCAASDLFEWLIQPGLIAKWFGPKHWSVGAVQTDTRIGGKYSIELIKSDSQKFFVVGEYLEINAPNTLVFSFQYQGSSSNPPDSTIKINITELSETKSQLSFTQDFVSTPPDFHKRTEAWEAMFQLLESLINS